MRRITPDVCVIGAGSGGLSVAAGAVQMGASVVLIEGHRMGGDCLNYGCVPSKALIAAAGQAQAMRQGAAMGIAPVSPDVDYAAAKDHVARVIAAIAPADSQERFEALGCTVLRDWARFISRTEVQAGDTVVAARRFVIATGSHPLVPDLPGLDGVPYLTNETLFDLRERPEHLLIVGGGPIGLEMAQAHRRLGCRVTVIEGERALGKDDPEMAAVVLDRLRGEGVEIVEGRRVTQVSGRAGSITLATDGSTDGETGGETGGGTHEGTHLLIAVGRDIALQRLDLDRGGVAHDRGIRTDAGLRSVTNRRVYAVGDAAGGLMFTHVAGYHAGVVVRAILFGLPATARRDHLPWVTYTDPELAHVGLTEAQARKRHGRGLSVVRFPYDENDRAVASRRTTGLVKVMVAGGRPVGASIAGAEAGELIGMWAMGIANRQKMKAIADTVLPYPTLAEINKRAAGAYFAPRLFASPWVKRAVGLVQRLVP